MAQTGSVVSSTLLHDFMREHMGLSGFISSLLCKQPAANSFIGLYLVVYWMPVCVRACVYFAKVVCAYVRVQDVLLY